VLISVTADTTEI